MQLLFCSEAATVFFLFLAGCNRTFYRRQFTSGPRCFQTEINLPVSFLHDIMENAFKTGKQNILYDVFVGSDSQTISS